MASKKILFPTDFSHTGDAAFTMACSLARDTNSELLIAHVEEPPLAYGGGENYYGVPQPATDDMRRMLEEIVPSDSSIRYEYRLVTGEPAGAIVRLAEAEQVDMIVLGTHGRTGLMRLLMGSVAEAIVRTASCPVLTFRQGSAQVVEN